MALFNITNNKIKQLIKLFSFRTSNNNINIDTTNLRISETQITEEEWLN